MSVNKEVSTGTRAEQWRHLVASRIAGELRPDPGQSRHAKVSSLLHAFRSEGVHCDVAEMKGALAAQGVTLRDDRPGVSRRDVIDLHLEEGVVADVGQPSGGAGIRVSFWSPGGAGRLEPLLESHDSTGAVRDVIRWFDVDPRGSDPSLEDVQRLMRLAGFELIVALAPFDDSDRLQAADLQWMTSEQRIELNRRSVSQADELRAAFLTATRG